MARLVLVFGLVVAVGCAPARSKIAGRTGMVLALAGVATIVTSAAVSPYTTQADELMIGGSLMSAAGILLYAAHDLSQPEIIYKQEPTERKHARWARMLTEHAAGAARNGNCARVRKFEPRVRLYDVNYHDFVFMRDPEILRCLTPSAAPVDDAAPFESGEP